MADKTVELIVKIKNIGLEQIKQLTKSIQTLKKEVGAFQVKPFNDLSKDISRATRDIGSIEGVITSSADKVSKQVSDRVNDTLDNVNDKFAKGAETFASRVVLLVGSTLTFANKSFFKLLINLQRGFKVVTNTSTQFKIVTLDTFGKISEVGLFVRGLFSNIASQVNSGLITPFIQFNSFLSSIAVTASRTFGPAGVFTVFLGRIAAGSIFFFTIKGLLGEVNTLTRRLIGTGTEALTPLERATRLVTTLDSGLNAVGFTVGRLLATATFGLASIFGPFSGIIAGIPFINSSITLLTNSLTKVRLQLFSFFGSARASVALIFLQGRTALTKLSNLFNPIVDNFVKSREQAEILTKSINDGAKSGKKFVEPLQRLAATKFPFFVQFQSFTFEVRAFSEQILKQITQIFLLISQQFGLSKAQITDISNKASESVGKVTKQIDKGLGAFRGGLLTSKNFPTFQKFFNIFSRSGKQSIDKFQKEFQKLGDSGTLGKTTGIAKKLKDEFEKSKKSVEDLGKSGVKVEESVKKTLALVTQTKSPVMSLVSEIPKAATQLKVMGKDVIDIGGGNQLILRSTQQIKAEVTGLAKELKELLIILLKAARQSDIFRKQSLAAEGTRGTNLAAQRRRNLEALVNALLRLAKTTGDTERAFASIRKNLRIIIELLGVLEAGSKRSQSTFSFQRKLLEDFSNIRVTNLDRFNVAFNEFVKSVTGKGLAQLTSKEAGRVGLKFVQLYVDGVKAGTPQAIKVLEAFAESIASLFPRSPAKRGPLKGFEKSGIEFTKLFSTGVKSGVKNAENSVLFLAQRIAGYFPQSLPLYGPLRKIISMGLKIPKLLSQGIRGGFRLVNDVVSELTNIIITPLNKIAEVGDVADRVGLSATAYSALANSFEALGSSGSEANFILASINRQLANPDTKAFKELGIDIAQVKSSSQPTLELFLQISDLIKSLPSDSNALKKALELVGATANTQVFNVLKAGREEIEGFISDSVKLGTTVSDEQVKISRQIRAIFTQITQVKDFVFINFLNPILPKLQEILVNSLNFLKDNQSSIQAILQILGEGVLAIGKTIKIVVETAINEPQRGLNLLTGILSAFGEFVLSLSKQLLDDVAIEIGVFLVKASTTLFSGIGTFFKEGTIEVLRQVRLLATKVVSKFIETFLPLVQSFAKRLPTRVAKFLNLDVIANLTADEITGVSKLVEEEGKKSGNFLKRVVDNVRNDVSVLGDATRNVLTETFKQDAAKDFQKSFDDLVLNLKASFGNLQDELPNFSDIFSIDNFAEILAQIEEIKNKTVDSLGVISTTEEQVNAKREATEARLTKIRGENDKKNSDNFYKGIQETLTGLGTVASGTQDIFNTLFEETGKSIKAFFFLAKGAAIAQATINIAQGVTKAIAEGGVLGIATGALVAAKGAIEIAKITSQNFNTGGQVFGPGGIDKVPANLTAGEFVQPVDVVRKYGLSFMESVRRGAFPLALAKQGIPNYPLAYKAPSGNYATGGAVTPGFTNAQNVDPQQQQEKDINVMNFVDPNIVGKFLNTANGKRTLINVLGGESRELKRIMST